MAQFLALVTQAEALVAQAKAFVAPPFHFLALVAFRPEAFVAKVHLILHSSCIHIPWLFVD